MNRVAAIALGLLLLACAPAQLVAGVQPESSPMTAAEDLQPLPPYAKESPPPGADREIVEGLWRLQTVAADDQTLTIRVATSGCIQFDHATARYDDGSIVITSWNEIWIPNGNFACITPLWLYEHRVRLGEPVRGRNILGECRAGDASPAERQCEFLRGAVEGSSN